MERQEQGWEPSLCHALWLVMNKKRLVTREGNFFFFLIHSQVELFSRSRKWCESDWRRRNNVKFSPLEESMRRFRLVRLEALGLAVLLQTDVV